MRRRRDRLAPLLRVARARERLERAALMDASRRLDDAERARSLCARDRRRVLATLGAELANEGVCGADVAAWNARVGMAHLRDVRAAAVEAEATSHAKDAQDRYAERVTERRVVEALDERRRQAWAAWRRHVEQVEADERAARRKVNP